MNYQVTSRQSDVCCIAQAQVSCRNSIAYMGFMKITVQVIPLGLTNSICTPYIPLMSTYIEPEKAVTEKYNIYQVNVSE